MPVILYTAGDRDPEAELQASRSGARKIVFGVEDARNLLTVVQQLLETQR